MQGGQAEHLLEQLGALLAAQQQSPLGKEEPGKTDTSLQALGWIQEGSAHFQTLLCWRLFGVGRLSEGL